MDAEYDIFEIVTVMRDFWLVDAESYQRRYCTQHGEPLTSGYYVVMWPEHIRIRRFNEYAAYHGPFKFRQEAQVVLEWMRREQERFWLAMQAPVVDDAHYIAVKKTVTPRLPAEGAKNKRALLNSSVDCC